MVLPMELSPIKVKRISYIPLVFGGAVPASPSHHTFINGPIPFKFRIKEIVIPEWTGTNDQHRYYFLYSRNRDVGTTGPPAGDNILEQYSIVPYISNTGGFIPMKIPMNYLVDETGVYLKVHVENQAAAAGSIYIIVKILEVV